MQCIESSGANHLQQTPCRAGQKGGALDIRTDNGSGNDGPAADPIDRRHPAARPEAGMPQRLVEQALGPPQETRPPAPRPQRATVVWIYGRPEGMLHIAFVDGRVAAMHIGNPQAAEPAPSRAAEAKHRRRSDAAPGPRRAMRTSPARHSRAFFCCSMKSSCALLWTSIAALAASW